MKLKLSILFFIFISCTAISQSFTSSYQLQQDLRTAYQKALSKTTAYNTKRAITSNKDFIEYWTIIDASFTEKIIKISYYHDSEFIQENYYYDKEKLVYSTKSIAYIPDNSFAQSNQKCEYFLKQQSLIAVVPLGQEKVIGNRWSANTVQIRFNNRLKQLKKINP